MCITVVGSINVDFVAKVKSLVLPGETILAKESHYFPGGKGANQALACARLGGDTCFIGKLGNDSNAELALSLLSKSRCELKVTRLETAATGLAVILLDDSGENSIVVSSGANALWHETDEQIAQMLSDTTILVLQLEIPIDIVKRFLTIAKNMNIKTVLNPSPVSADIKDALPLVDLLLMNRTEAEYFIGESIKETSDCAQKIRSLGAGEAIVTSGAQGALIFQSASFVKIPAVEVNVTDTTAAGDTYTGALVAKLSKGEDLPSAARFASYASAIAVSKMGAQPSIPDCGDVELMMNQFK
jgi:ribokinase